MKRTFAIFAVAMAVACAASGRASAQAPADDLTVDAAREQYGKAEQRAIDAFERFVKELGREGRPSDIPPARDKIRPLVAESFDARKRLQLAELKELRRRLVEIEQAIERREKHRDAIIDLHVDELMDIRPSSLKSQTAQESTSGPQIKSVIVGPPIVAGAPASPLPGSAEQLAPADVRDGRQKAALVDSALDLDTREQLAQLELEEAEFELVAAGRELEVAKSDNARLEGVRKKKKAEYELKRARLKLAGLARQRAELQTAAEVEVAEAEAEVRRVEAKADVAKADVTVAEAQLENAQANVEGAAARLAHERKVFERLRELATVQKAVDMKLVDEKERNKLGAETALANAEGAVEMGQASLVRAKAALEEVVAELSVAQARLRAAQARRERLKPDNSPDAAEAGSSESAPAKPEDKERR